MAIHLSGNGGRTAGFVEMERLSAGVEPSTHPSTALRPVYLAYTLRALGGRRPADPKPRNTLGHSMLKLYVTDVTFTARGLPWNKVRECWRWTGCLSNRVGAPEEGPGR